MTIYITPTPGSQPAPLDRWRALSQIHRDIWQEILECPETVLETAAHKISLRQLRYCAYYAPHIAYEMRHKVTAKRRAVILGYTFEIAELVFFGAELKAYMDEIWDSIIDHSEIWKVTFGHDWRRPMLSLQLFLGIELGQSEEDAPPLVPVRPTEPEAAPGIRASS